MADKNTRQLSPKELQDDLESYAGMEGLGGYAPANADYKAANGATLKTAMEGSQTQEVQDFGTWQASRDRKVIDEWAFHDFVRNMRTQVKAQYGESSDELASVGLKKKSEYKNPKPKNPPTP